MAYARIACLTLLFSLALPVVASAQENDPLSARAPRRMRFGLDAGVGFVTGDSRGGALNVNLQLGYQGSDIWALYYQTGLALNGWANDDESVDTYAFWSNLAMFDVTLGDALQLGFGAGADVGSFGICANDRCEMQESETQLATEARLAVIIPLPGVRARMGIPIALRFHSTYFADAAMHTVTVSAGIMRF